MTGVCDDCGLVFEIPEPPPAGYGRYAAPTRLCPDHLAVWYANRDQAYAKAAHLRARLHAAPGEAAVVQEEWLEFLKGRRELGSSK